MYRHQSQARCALVCAHTASSAAGVTTNSRWQWLTTSTTSTPAAAACPCWLLLLLVAQVVEGGIMGMGTVNRSSMAMVVMPSPFRYSSPILVRGEMNWRAWIARWRGVFIALIVMVSVFGALLLACLGLLVWRLCKAGKRKRTFMASMNDGIGHIPTTQMDVALTGASSIENGARRPTSAGL